MGRRLSPWPSAVPLWLQSSRATRVRSARIGWVHAFGCSSQVLSTLIVGSLLVGLRHLLTSLSFSPPYDPYWICFFEPQLLTLALLGVLPWYCLLVCLASLHLSGWQRFSACSFMTSVLDPVRLWHPSLAPMLQQQRPSHLLLAFGSPFSLLCPPVCGCLELSSFFSLCFYTCFL